MISLPTLDSDNGLIPGDIAPDEQVVAWLRRYLPDFYFVNAPLSRMRRHLALLQTLPQHPVIIDFHRSPGAGFTELTVCANDQVKPGLLSQVAGTLAHLKINVHTAWIHTLDDPFSTPEANGQNRRVVLDTLLLSEPFFRRTRALSPKTQKGLASALLEVLNGRAPLFDSTPRFLRASLAPMEVLDLTATPMGAHTLLKLRAADSSGVLYRITSALAALDLNVAHAQINTFEKAVDDVFFVAGPNGGPLPDESLNQTLEDLRDALTAELILGDANPMSRG